MDMVVFFAVLLTAFDAMATSLLKDRGASRNTALVFWCVMQVTAFSGAFVFLGWQGTLMAAVLSAVLSGMLGYHKVRAQRFG